MLKVGGAGKMSELERGVPKGTAGAAATGGAKMMVVRGEVYMPCICDAPEHLGRILRGKKKSSVHYGILPYSNNFA